MRFEDEFQSMLRIVLIRPGCTDFDEQGRIKGTLDMPLSDKGVQQAEQAAEALANAGIEVVYSAPCQSALQTAEMVAGRLELKVKPVDTLHNLDHGLWHGKLIEEIKQRQPKVYRMWQEQPETVCPPEGETLAAARLRVQKALKRLLKKHKRGVVGLVVSEPLASIVRCCLQHGELGDLWKSECDFGAWENIDIEPPTEADVGAVEG
jgi:probable phosphoglycerate mutase